MKAIGDLLQDIKPLRDRLDEAKQFARLQAIVDRAVSDAGLSGEEVRALQMTDGNLRLGVADAASAARLRQASATLLDRISEQAPAVKKIEVRVCVPLPPPLDLPLSLRRQGRDGAP